MDKTDLLGLAYADLLVGQYDCVDRIILNAYFGFACSPGGFRLWWRNLTGIDDTLDNAHLIRMAGRFSRCVRGWAKKENIPVIDCAAGERKHNIAQEHLPTDPKRTGIFLILVNRAPASIWDVKRYGKGGIDLRRNYQPCQAAYDLKKLRGKLLVRKSARPACMKHRLTGCERWWRWGWCVKRSEARAA